MGVSYVNVGECFVGKSTRSRSSLFMVYSNLPLDDSYALCYLPQTNSMIVSNGEFLQAHHLPAFLYKALYRFTGSVILKIAYGYDTLDNDDPMIGKAHAFNSGVDIVTEPGYMIELLPWRTSVYAIWSIADSSVQFDICQAGFHSQDSSARRPRSKVTTLRHGMLRSHTLFPRWLVFLS